MNNSVFQSISDASPMGILVTDMAGNCTYANQRCRDLFGQPEKAILGRGWIQVIDPEDRCKIPDNCLMLADQLPYSTHIRFPKPDGQLLWASITVNSFGVDDAKGLLWTLDDITERKQVSETLENTIAHFKAFLESSGAAIYSLDCEFRITMFNQIFKDLIRKHRNKDVLVGDNILDMSNKGDSKDDKTLGDIFKSVRNGNRFSGIVELGEPAVFRSPIEMSCSPILGEDGKVTGIAVFGRDVTEKLDMQKDFQEKTQLLNTLLENLPVVVYKFNREGVVTLSVGAGLKELGLKDNELVGSLAKDVLPQVADLLKGTYTGELSRFISTGYQADGSRIYFQNVAFSDAAIEGGVIGMSLDITAIKQAEAETRKAMELAEIAALAKQQFLSNMSHEIRTPLNAIIGMTYILLQDNTSPEQEENLNILKFSGENLLALVNDILDYTKIISGRVEFEEVDFILTDFITSIKQSHQFRADEKNISFIVKTDPRLPDKLNGDTTRLAQVLNNLVSNAIKFTSVGSVTLELSMHKLTKESVEIDFRIRDTGIGIDPSLKEYIFENFTQASSDTTRRFGGTGLGLAITKRLLQLKGSDIYMESDHGKGSLFYFRLKLKRSQQGQSYMSNNVFGGSMDETKSLSGFRVLLVEDNEMNRIVAVKFMKKWLLDVALAQNGEEALQEITRQHFHLVLMDLQMPRMDGYEATRRIRALPGDWYYKIPIVALTASVEAEIIDRIKLAGMDDHMTKPFNPNELYNKIAQYLPAS